MKKILFLSILTLIQIPLSAQGIFQPAFDVEVEVVEASFKKEGITTYPFNKKKQVNCTDEIYIHIKLRNYGTKKMIGARISGEYILNGKSKGKLNLYKNSWKMSSNPTSITGFPMDLSGAYQNTDSTGGLPVSTLTNPLTNPFLKGIDILVKAPFKASVPGQKPDINKYVFKIDGKIYDYDTKTFHNDAKPANNKTEESYLKECDEDKKYTDAIPLTAFIDSNEEAIGALLYPVPVAQGAKLTLELNDKVVKDQRDVEIRIFRRDSGKEVKPSKTDAGYRKICIETRTLPGGVYVMRITYPDRKTQIITFGVR